MSEANDGDDGDTLPFTIFKQTEAWKFSDHRDSNAGTAKYTRPDAERLLYIKIY